MVTLRTARLSWWCVTLPSSVLFGDGRSTDSACLPEQGRPTRRRPRWAGIGLAVAVDKNTVISTSIAIWTIADVFQCTFTNTHITICTHVSVAWSCPIVVWIAYVWTVAELSYIYRINRPLCFPVTHSCLWIVASFGNGEPNQVYPGIPHARTCQASVDCMRTSFHRYRGYGSNFRHLGYSKSHAVLAMREWVEYPRLYVSGYCSFCHCNGASRAHLA